VLIPDQPGCCWGTAARLPKLPGSQKLTPPSSALTVIEATVATTSASAAANVFLNRLFAHCFIWQLRNSLTTLSALYTCQTSSDAARLNFVAVSPKGNGVLVDEVTG